MKTTKIKSITILFLYISSFININSTLISEGYHFFDPLYYRDMYKGFLKQKKNNKCSIDDGPNCIYIEGKNKLEISKELENIYPDSDNFLKETPENILLKLKETSKLITNKDEKDLDEEVFSFDSPYVMSLYLTFESYDEITKKGDIYAPETIDTPYDIGRLTLTIIGKLRLSQKNSKEFESPLVRNIREEGPKGTYAFVESKEVIIKFNSKSSISSVYIKKNSFNKDNKTFFLYGYKNGHKYVISKIQNVPSNQWLKIIGDGKKYDSVGIPRGFDYDNFVINASVNMDNSMYKINYSKRRSSFLNEKINGAILDALNQIKNGEIKTENGLGAIKVVKIDLNQNEIIQQQEEDFDIPEELMNELNKQKNIEENENKNMKKNINEEKPNDKDNINNQDL